MAVDDCKAVQLNNEALTLNSSPSRETNPTLIPTISVYKYVLSNKAETRHAQVANATSGF